ncbi:acetyl-CoA carboxylase biotin carboxylase subunit [Arvimicrobium flavum]|uniref:acetyl-CoA carboxylase biotin carboxylase subunit n=1 Tax=Arvimicrobium flavum TaxID=3393320 RepID=UPI00237C505A|nr:biotin carboxylase N-terminal domain-containing protein [Mesorhizobium shangrilense]
MRKLLVANRGEIACRVMRTAQANGVRTVAVFSEADRNAMHVEMADEARLIGAAQAAQSYLDPARILEAARESGADAVHPGYGFLSENAGFAEAVIKADLTWVGPSPETIRLMGDKQTARSTAANAGVPVVPGSRRFAPGDLAGLAEAASEVGFPVLIKAAAGGGGIGMRQAEGPDKLEELVVAVQEAAQKSFGNGDIYLERFLPKARHVEIQVFGFGDGRAIHLHERDCSLQRRFQKVIEEAPAPGLPEQVRARMAEAALALCGSTRYSGLGTVEFIVDAATFEFFFLEMNTRIQVEHPVTEMITGIDLVGLQLALAGGQTGELPGETPPRRGCAIECRLYAENPAKMFFPSPGRLTTFQLPAPRDGLRIDTGYRQGDTVTPFYDPMIAKIIVHGDTREAAIAKAVVALEELSVDGISTNRGFLLACLRHEAFAEGAVHTKFIDTYKNELLDAVRQAEAVAA